MATTSQDSLRIAGSAADADAKLPIVFRRVGMPGAGSSFHHCFNLPAGV